MMIFFITNGCLLPIQVIFIGTMHICLSPSNEGKTKCITFNWHPTFSKNHWFMLQTTKDFVKNIFSIYLSNQIQQLNLSKTYKLVWFINCWNVHKSKEFHNCIKKTP
jgi:hypothetical protein